MDAIAMLHQHLTAIAAQHGMEATMHGHKQWVPATRDESAYWDDGRLLKLTPTRVPSRPLLELEQDDQGVVRIYKHRESDLTAAFKGRAVTFDWVVAFIAANADAARRLSGRGAPSEPRARTHVLPTPPAPAAGSWEILQAERHQVACACQGRNDACARCDGRGTYQVDGLGNPV
ncbi:MAG TPA: hypothetical protein VME63_02320 [Dyella sp.]|uniref:hypothetical protein n=1 Tax=Dyella sp. TaxID=1869338 RepID=UPI002BEF02E3|nr:hypothetical protein [Dyella sp.]HTV84209.1 hypothetical protein [Dyella sp.]